MMNLTFLKYFCDAAENSSVGVAAKINHVSSSAVSVSIRKLGEYFGKELLSHRKNHFELTSEGRYLYVRGKALLASARNLEEDILGGSSDFSGRLEFGVQESLAQSLLPRLVRSFSSIYGDITLKPKFGDKAQLRKIVEEEAAEFFVAMSDHSLASFDSVELLSGEYKYLNFSGIKDLTKVSVALSDDPVENSEFQRAFSKFFNADPIIGIVVPTWESALEFAKRNRLAAIVPNFVSSEKVAKNTPPLKYSLRAYFRRGAILSSKAQLFIEQVLQNLNKRS